MITEQDMQRIVPDENPKDRVGACKPPLHLIPAAAEITESMVMALGAAKYEPFNWRRTKIRASIYVSATRRHLAQFFDGEDNDPESGISHLAHARACLGILIDAMATNHLIDDRPPPGAASELIEQFTSRKQVSKHSLSMESQQHASEETNAYSDA